MKIKSRNDKLVELSMTKQPEEMFGGTCGYAAKTPGAPNLWELNENVERLDTEKAKMFHSVAAELLHVTKRTRPDIETEEAYFTTRAANINMKDWKKVRRCITFRNQSKEYM